MVDEKLRCSTWNKINAGTNPIKENLFVNVLSSFIVVLRQLICHEILKAVLKLHAIHPRICDEFSLLWLVVTLYLHFIHSWAHFHFNHLHWLFKPR